MSVQLLEFKVKDHLFAIKTDNVKLVFEVENIKKTVPIEDYLCGITTYANKSYLLIDFAKLIGLGKICDGSISGKTAIVVDVFGKTYALVVDKIVRINEVRKKDYEGDIVSFYKDQNIVIEEITPEFLNLKIKVPPLKQIISHQEEETLIQKRKKEKNEQNFLIFALEDFLYGINSQFVKKVEYLDTLNETPLKEDGWIEGVVLVKETPIKVGNLKKLLNLPEEKDKENLIVIQNDKKGFGFFADEIVDIYPLEENKIHKSVDGNILKNFFIYQNKVVPILSESFLKEVLEKYSLDITDEDHQTDTQSLDKEAFLLIRIGSKIFAIPMEYLDEVIEYKDIHLSNYPNENPLIKGIAAYRKISFFLISLEPILKEEIGEDKKILLLRKDDKVISLLINDIYDLIEVPKTNVFILDTDETLLGGTILNDGDVIELLNVNWLFR